MPVTGYTRCEFKHYIMKKFLILTQIAIAVITTTKSNGQALLQNKVSLDTIITTGFEMQDMFENYSGCLYQQFFWFHVPNWEETDSITLVRMNVSSQHFDTIYGIIPSLADKIPWPTSYAIAVNNKYCAIRFYRSIAIFDVNNSSLTFRRIFPIIQDFSYCKLQDNRLVLGKSYNFHPLDEPEPVSIAVYDIPSDKFVNTIYPSIKNIEFSHFHPYHWIDASEHYILLSQTTEYKIEIFDQNLKLVSQISRSVLGWNQFDTGAMRNITKDIPLNNAKMRIEKISPYQDRVSRVEAAYMLDDSTVLVRYIPPDNKSKKRQRFIDIWKFRQGKWDLLAADLEDSNLSSKEIVTKNNMRVMGLNNPSYFSNQYLIMLTSGTNVYPFGKKYSDLQKEEDDYYVEHDPILKIYIYTLKSL